MAAEANTSSETTLTEEQIIAHNAEVSRKISTLTGEKEKYARVGGNASSIASSLLGLSTNAKEIGDFLEVFVISGTAFDNGNFNQMGANFESMAGFFNTIKGMCDEAIAKLEDEIGALRASYW